MSDINETTRYASKRIRKRVSQVHEANRVANIKAGGRKARRAKSVKTYRYGGASIKETFMANRRKDGTSRNRRVRTI